MDIGFIKIKNTDVNCRFLGLFFYEIGMNSAPEFNCEENFVIMIDYITNSFAFVVDIKLP